MSTATMAPQTQRKDWFNLARGILMVLLFVYHSEVYYGDEHTWSFLFAPFFLTGFFIISGYFFSSADPAKFNFRAKALQTLRALIIPYFIFTIAFAVPKIIMYHTSPWQNIIDIVLLRASWFVVVIAICQLAYGAMVSRGFGMRKMAVATVIIFAVGYLTVILYRLNPPVLTESRLLYSESLPNRWPACLNIALVMMPFFFLGIVMRRCEHRMRYLESWAAIVAAVAIYVAVVWLDHLYIGSDIVVAVHHYNNILVISLYAIAGTWILLSLSRKIGSIRVLNYIGKNSIVFYFLNGAMLQITATIVTRIMKLTPVNNGGGYFMTIIVALVACAATIPVCWFINKNLPLIVGKKEAWQRFRLFAR